MNQSTKNAFDSVNDNLPAWDLEALFGYDRQGEIYEADFTKLEVLIDRFADQYQGRLANLNGDALAEAFDKMQEIKALRGKIETYARCKYAQDVVESADVYSGFEKRYAELAVRIQFFDYEIQSLNSDTLKHGYANSDALRRYEPVIENMRRSTAHMMSPEVRKYATESQARRTFKNMYTRQQAALRFEFEGETITKNDILGIAYFDPDGARRRQAFTEYERVMHDAAPDFADIFNGLMALHAAEDAARNFDTPDASRHFSNKVPAETVYALVDGVRGSYARTSHRFHDLKARLMGLDTLSPADRIINVFDSDDDVKITWDDAKEIVIDAYMSFDPEIGAIVQGFFDNGWIDAAKRENKEQGNFASRGALELVHSLVHLNFDGSARDVMNVAHELGHGAHHMLSRDKESLVSTPRILAETASVFGEMLVFKSLMRKARSDQDKKKILFHKISESLDNVVRQIAFFDFERRMHTEFREGNGTLKPEYFERLWMDVSRESLGPSVALSEKHGGIFSGVLHFVHYPFFVYNYASGDALVNALYQKYEDGEMPADEFKEKYKDMLRAAGTYKLEDLKTDFGLDVNDPAFWERGLKVIEAMIDELEQLCAAELEITADARAGVETDLNTGQNYG